MQKCVDEQALSCDLRETALCTFIFKTTTAYFNYCWRYDDATNGFHSAKFGLCEKVVVNYQRSVFEKLDESIELQLLSTYPVFCPMNMRSPKHILKKL